MRKEIMDIYDEIIKNVNVRNHDRYRSNINKMRSLLDISDLDFFEKGFLFWQIQDHYALLRDFDKELEIFKRFVVFVRETDNRYLFWTVCDMTQVLTMRLGGYNKEWDAVYRECKSIEATSNEFVRVKFEMFRAYVGIFNDTRVLIDSKLIEDAIKEIGSIIAKYPKHPDSLFFRLIFYVSTIKYRNHIKEPISDVKERITLEIQNINEALLDTQENVFDHDKLLFGTWHQISAPKGSYYSAYTGLTNLLFALVESDEIDFIEYLLKNIKNYKTSNQRLFRLLEMKGMNI